MGVVLDFETEWVVLNGMYVRYLVMIGTGTLTLCIISQLGHIRYVENKKKDVLFRKKYFCFVRQFLRYTVNLLNLKYTYAISMFYYKLYNHS